MIYRPNGDGGWIYDPSGYTQESARAWIKAEIERCASDPVYFLTHYCYAQNLHDEDSTPQVPTLDLFPDWPHVRALVSAMFPPRDVLIEKSRRMLASWLAMAVLTWDMVFRQQWPTMVVSRVEDDVDDGGSASTPRTLLGKVRFVWEHLPPFLRQQELEFRHLSVRNPTTGSYIAGYPSGQSPGRSGGFKRAICDEFAFQEHTEQVLSSVVQACISGKVYLSTPHGKGNAFFRIAEMVSRPVWPPVGSEYYQKLPTYLRTVARAQATGPVERFTVHWTQHPHKDKLWRERAVVGMTEEKIAQELDINYTKSLGLRVYPKYAEDQHMAGGPLCPLKGLSYAQGRPLIIACDWNHDPLIWEIAQQYAVEPCYRVIDELCLRSAVVDDALFEFIWRYGSANAVMQVRAENPDWKPRLESVTALAGIDGHREQLIVYGDATEEKSTVHNRVKTYQHVKAVLRGAGFNVVLRVPPSNPSIDRRIEVVNHALQTNWLVVSQDCEELRKDFESGTWNSKQNDMDQLTEDDDGSGLTRSHASSAIGYWLCCVHRVMTSESPTTRAFARSAASYLPKMVGGW